ncbi:hypothetical protein [Terasakiella sp. SH-1]|uniref:hypothetical protein n=1 Tax=Terasakiella sp. SH-1 TaxID=2560057 RepID=UPI0010736046|nr:hypothetical protein [Terasakiella sp. SH-1]
MTNHIESITAIVDGTFTHKDAKSFHRQFYADGEIALTVAYSKVQGWYIQTFENLRYDFPKAYIEIIIYAGFKHISIEHLQAEDA